jgi:hypothetical protein
MFNTIADTFYCEDIHGPISDVRCPKSLSQLDQQKRKKVMESDKKSMPLPIRKESDAGPPPYTNNKH